MRKATDSAAAVTVQHASKTFRIPNEAVHTLKERALHPFRRTGYQQLEALRDISFAVQPGEFFGIVGRNGSGKSTLLKCLAGIYRLDRGDIYLNGRLSTFIELGVGFNMDLAAHDNIVMNATMLGLSPREARSRVDEVIEFAELEEFVDLKLKNYSSGMQVRLAFSVMIQVDADILLIDEVLAVGDASFQQKCFDAFERMRELGRTVLFVSHDMGAVNRFCDRAMLLEHGRIAAIGETNEVAKRYIELNFDIEETVPKDGRPKVGDQKAEILEAWTEDGHGRRTKVLSQGEPCVVKARVEFHETVDNPELMVAFVNDYKHNQFVASATDRLGATGRFEAGEVVTFSAKFTNYFAPGSYQTSVLVAHHGNVNRIIDRWERIFAVAVTAQRPSWGLVDLPVEIDLERSSADDRSTADAERREGTAGQV